MGCVKKKIELTCIFIVNLSPIFNRGIGVFTMSILACVNICAVLRVKESVKKRKDKMTR